MTRYNRSLATVIFSGAVFTSVHFQKIAQKSSLCDCHYISEGSCGFLPDLKNRSRQGWNVKLLPCVFSSKNWLYSILSSSLVIRKDIFGFCQRVYFWCLPLFCILHGIVTVSPTLTFMVCPP